MPRVEFEADTEEELLSLAWRWVMGPRRSSPAAANDVRREEQTGVRRRELGEVLNGIRGADSRRFLREVAELSLNDAALPLDADLRKRYGKSTGTAFAGIVAGPNKVMRRVARRDLIEWDADARGYRMDPDDARVVLERWPAP